MNSKETIQLNVSKEQIEKLFKDEEINCAYRESVGDNKKYLDLIERLKCRYRGGFLASFVFSQNVFHEGNELRIKRDLLNFALRDVIEERKNIYVSIFEILNEGGYQKALDNLEKEITESFDQYYGKINVDFEKDED